MYTLKQIPEDFIVKEIGLVKHIGSAESKRYLYFTLMKKNWNTLDAIQQIAKALHIKENTIGFAGSKDRHALTEQMISFKDISRKKIEQINLKDITLTFVGYGDEPITLGSLGGNRFEITIRNLDEHCKLRQGNLKYIPNYFDEQRFSKHNIPIGKHLIKKEFAEAVQLINEIRCNDYLISRKNDFIGALSLLPQRRLLMYVHAYQSYLWNETLARFMMEKNMKSELHNNTIFKVKYSAGELIFCMDSFTEENKDLVIPLVGFNTLNIGDDDLLTRDLISRIIRGMMQEQKINHGDFIIRPMPKLSLEGENRLAFIEVKGLTITPLLDDELNSGMKKAKIYFSLPKGSYATIVVKALIGNC
ncbi:tRNA pseudouridine(13) synthase TruD [Candidatus Woesearchaeota archaeon]|nr:tRNA pseudouridine(13) synthase TruD [Candidatus Woesearchaeota archaeon]